MASLTRSGEWNEAGAVAYLIHPCATGATLPRRGVRAGRLGAVAHHVP